MNEEYDPAFPNDFKQWKNEKVSFYEKFEEKPEKIETVVVVLNMAEELDEECEDDIRQEASRYGEIVDFAQNLDFDSEFSIQFYIKFKFSKEAQNFLKNMHGRFYDGKKLIVQFYSEQEFNNNNLGKITKN
jgi:hypothetical protein